MSDNEPAMQQGIASIAQEIACYLQAREQVADTLEGIMKWWLPRQRFYEERQRVEQAVEYLYKNGVIDKRTLPDGSVVYIAV